jgi:predicted metal-dependent phosphoesterase TrpH
VGRADLHIHTRVSDGMATVESVLEHVERNTTLDVVAITDHEDETGGQRAREIAARRGYRFEVVVGAEVTTMQGHLLALYIEQAPPSFRSVEATLEAIHAQGGVAIVPHPMSWLTRSIGERTLDKVMARRESGILFDAIETQNPSLAGRVTRAKAERLNRGWGLPATGGSDAHYLPHIGAAQTEFEGASAEDLKRALLAGEVAAVPGAYGPLLQLGVHRLLLQLAWGYSATPRKLFRRRAAAPRTSPVR